MKPQDNRNPLWPLLVAGTLLPSLAAADLAALQDAVTLGKANVELRLRYEHVDADDALRDADAVTLRSLLGYTTQTWQGFSAYAEMENVSALHDDYAPERPGYALVLDPTDSELNRWGLRYSGLPGLTATLGRQRLVFDNARWVGNAIWRQNEQTFDGLSLQYAPLSTLMLSYAYIGNVNTVAFTDIDLDGHLFNARWSVLPALSLSAYAYLLDYMLATATDFDTYGLRADGACALGAALRLLYTAEYAAQRSQTASAGFDTDYRFVEAGLAFRPLTLRLGYEQLGSDHGAAALQTPLATKHLFNGWADLFLQTPAGGLDDLYIGMSGKLGRTQLQASYHDFRAVAAQSAVEHYGDEVDVAASMPLAHGLSGLLKLAHYDADQFGVDTDKFWAQLEYKF